mmetsp:Transcript_63934/g.106780  ORF Transcript_63934/g.106780 Transcript_63934/m.106780 type:complete len:85 (+) Transcript_63934:383-637(+)
MQRGSKAEPRQQRRGTKPLISASHLPVPGDLLRPMRRVPLHDPPHGGSARVIEGRTDPDGNRVGMGRSVTCRDSEAASCVVHHV